MRALVTGADGLLGRHVVNALLRAGHEVRAVMGPRARIHRPEWPTAVDALHVDLTEAAPPNTAFDGIDVLVHLAAKVLGDDRERIAVAVEGTQRLLDAMARSRTRRLVLASSLVVYDWVRIDGVLTEASPMRRPESAGSDSYARAKLCQEEIARRVSEREGWDLTILRPSSLFGPGRMDAGDVGRYLGPLLFVVGPRRRLRLTYVENCADAIVRACERPRPQPLTVNVVDPSEIRAWSWARECLRHAGSSGLRVPLPYRPLRALLRGAGVAARVLTGGRHGLPGILDLARFDAQFKPVACSTDALRRELGWAPRFDPAEALARARGASTPRAEARRAIPW